MNLLERIRTHIHTHTLILDLHMYLFNVKDRIQTDELRCTLYLHPNIRRAYINSLKRICTYAHALILDLHKYRLNMKDRI